MRSYFNFNKKLAERYDDWMVALHYAPHTRQSYGRTIRFFREFLGSRSMASVTHLEIRQFMTRVTEGGATWHTTYNHLGVTPRYDRGCCQARDDALNRLWSSVLIVIFYGKQDWLGSYLEDFPQEIGLRRRGVAPT